MAQLVTEVTGVAVDGDRPDLVGVAGEEFAGPGLQALQAGRGAKVPEVGRQNELVAQGQGRRTFQVATEGEHPHRKCPLSAAVTNVLPLDDVLFVMTEDWLTGGLTARFDWDDLTSDWLATAMKKADGVIEEIKPKKKKGT